MFAGCFVVIASAGPRMYLFETHSIHAGVKRPVDTPGLFSVRPSRC
jgi:hypothetical protein